VKTFAKRPFTLLGVNSDRDLDVARDCVKRLQVNWRSIADGGTQGPNSNLWQIQSWPSTFLIDHRGVIRYRDLRGAEEDRRLRELIEEAEKDQRR
jgi:peroxiredoxin